MSGKTEPEIFGRMWIRGGILSGGRPVRPIMSVAVNERGGLRLLSFLLFNINRNRLLRHKFTGLKCFTMAADLVKINT